MRYTASIANRTSTRRVTVQTGLQGALPLKHEFTSHNAAATNSTPAPHKPGGLSSPDADQADPPEPHSPYAYASSDAAPAV